MENFSLIAKKEIRQHEKQSSYEDQSSKVQNQSSK